MNFLIVDDDFGCRRGMALTLQDAYPESSIFEARSVSSAIAVLRSQESVDLILLDLTLDDSHGLQTLKRLKSWCEENECNPRIVVVSAAADYVEALISQCIEECATGFIEKGTDETRFLLAIAMTLAGGMYVTERYAQGQGSVRSRREAEPDGIALTPRELQVLTLLVKGLTYKQVARRLQQDESSDTSISDNTVRVHVQRMAWKVKSARGDAADEELSAKAAVLTAFARNRFRTGMADRPK